MLSKRQSYALKHIKFLALKHKFAEPAGPKWIRRDIDATAVWNITSLEIPLQIISKGASHQRIVSD